MPSYILAVDQGTTSTRSILFRPDLSVAAVGQQEFPQHFPSSGWVEHEPEDLWRTTVDTIKAALEKASAAASDIAAIGITNQRETTLVWDRKTGKAIHKAIVWQDRRTADHCAALKQAGHEATILAQDRASARSLFLRHQDRLAHRQCRRRPAESGSGRARFRHRRYVPAVATDRRQGPCDGCDQCVAHACCSTSIAANGTTSYAGSCACRNRCCPRCAIYQATSAQTEAALFGRPIPIMGIAGDQQAATVGQACFAPGMIKSTYGTGCFALLNTGLAPVASRNRLLSTIAYQLKGERTYALEGAIFIAGAAVQWLRDGLKIIDTAQRTGELAQAADAEQQVYLDPRLCRTGGALLEAGSARRALRPDPRHRT